MMPDLWQYEHEVGHGKAEKEWRHQQKKPQAPQTAESEEHRDGQRDSH